MDAFTENASDLAMRHTTLPQEDDNELVGSSGWPFRPYGLNVLRDQLAVGSKGEYGGR